MGKNAKNDNDLDKFKGPLTTKQKKRLFPELLRANWWNITQTCRELNIDRSTYHRWIRTDKKFRQKIEDLQEEEKDLVEAIARKKILKDQDKTMIIFFLKTKAKDRGYVERQEMRYETEQTQSPLSFDLIRSLLVKRGTLDKIIEAGQELEKIKRESK